MFKVRIYGRNSSPMTLDLKDEYAEKLNEEAVIQIEDSYFEIVSRYKKENEMLVNLRYYPYPHLYEHRHFLTLKKENLQGNLKYRVA